MAAYQDISIRLADGYEAYGRYWPSPECKSAVLHVHGIQSHCGWYTMTAGALNRGGMAVLQPDRRGSGQNRGARGHADSPEQLIDDARRSAEWLCEHAGVGKVHLVGVSWGGKLIAALHATYPEIAETLTLVAPGLFPIIDVSPAEKFRIGWSMVSNPERLFDIPLNDPELFTSRPEWIDFLNNDELQVRQATAGFFLASRRMDRIAARLAKSPPVPLHLYLAAEERIIDNEKTMRMVRELAWPHRHTTVFNRSRHTFEFGDDRNDYLADLVAWLQAPESYGAVMPAAGR